MAGVCKTNWWEWAHWLSTLFMDSKPSATMSSLPPSGPTIKYLDH